MLLKTLETSVASVNSALQRARGSLSKRTPNEPTKFSPPQQTMLHRYVNAFESYDVDGLVSLMRQEVTFCMPPYSLWLQGPKDVGPGCLGWGVDAAAHAWSRPLPAAGRLLLSTRPDQRSGHKAWALIVLEVSGENISGVDNFLDVERLFPRFGFPQQFPPK